MFEKRGQATIFILLGLVVVGLVAGTYFARDYVFKSKIERMSEKALVVPKQAESVRNYIISCVKQITNEAVDLVGQQGGYIEIPGDPIPLTVYNKFSNNLEVLPGYRVPYWYYKKANNVDKLQILNLDQIGKNLGKYVDENLRVCIGTFEAFKKTGYKINPGLIKTDVEILDDKVLFEVKFPLHMEIKDFKFDFKEFYNKVEKPLGELYGLSKGLFNYENGKNFLEEKTIDMMVGYDEIPLTGESFDCGFSPIWDKFVVIENFKKSLGYNVPVLKIKGTEHGLNEEEKKYFEIDIGTVGENVDINFMYSSNWPFQLDVVPSENNILKADSISSGLAGRLKGLVDSFVCYTYWHFVYDVKYPVLIVLNKDGYTFQYAMMVVINKNKARENLQKPLFLPEPDVRFCDNKQFNIDINIYDDDGNPVNDADVSYKCINHVCPLGKTAGNYFSGLVMPCGNGFALANKDGYNYGKTEISTLNDVSVSVIMKKLKELDINVEVLRGGSGLLKDDEKIYVTLTNEEDDYSTTAIYPNDKKIKLITGNYKVSMFMIKESEDKIKIPAKEVEHCVSIPKSGVEGVFGGTEEKCISVNVPGIELDRVVTGAGEFEMFVSKSDLAKKNVKFYIPYQGVPRKYEDLSKLTNEVGEGFVYPKFS